MTLTKNSNFPVLNEFFRDRNSHQASKFNLNSPIRKAKTCVLAFVFDVEHLVIGLHP
jgi:hypothetical protein